MMATRLKQFGLLLFSMLICGVAFFQMFERTTGGFPQNYLWMLAFVGALFLTSWGTGNVHYCRGRRRSRGKK